AEAACRQLTDIAQHARIGSQSPCSPISASEPAPNVEGSTAKHHVEPCVDLALMIAYLLGQGRVSKKTTKHGKARRNVNVQITASVSCMPAVVEEGGG